MDTWTFTWHAGPDAGATQFTRHGATGRGIVGRAHDLALRADDPALQPYHALAEVANDATLRLTPLAGALHVDGAAVATSVVLHDAAWVEVGHSLVRVARSAPAPAPTPDPATGREGERCAGSAGSAGSAGGIVVRAPRAVPQWQPVAIDDPTPPDETATNHGGLLPTLVGLVGAGAIALVLHQPLFFLFGMLGGVVALAGWGTQRIATGRQRRDANRRYQVARAAVDRAREQARRNHRAAHEAATPGLVGLLPALHRDHRLWARRAADTDAFDVALGIGDIVSPVDGEPVRGVSIPVSLAPGARVGLRGPQALGVARALLVQLIANCGPADLRVVVVTDQAGGWEWLAVVPHATLPDGTPAIVRDQVLAASPANVPADLDDFGGHLLVVTDQPALLVTRTSALRRLLADQRRHALVAIVGDGPLPPVCTAALHTTLSPTARWEPDVRSDGLPTLVRIAAMGQAAAQRCADLLRGLCDPEDALAAAATVPRALSLAELWGGLPDAAAIAARWAAAGPDPAPRALVGLAADGAVDIDLVRDGPHGLIAGTTGAGKSELLRTLVLGMATNAGPDHLALVLVDYKGGATFDACAGLPHVVGVITDLDEHLADRALRSLHAELRRREGVLREHGAADLAELRALAPHAPLARLVVVVDEFAALAAEQPDFLHALVGIAQRGRSLGVHLLLATQRPNGVIDDDVRANTNLRLALRLQDVADAHDVVGVATPTTFARQLPGRAVLRLAADDHITFQAAHCSTRPGGDGGLRTPLQLVAAAVTDAARLVGSQRARAPWCPPLPTVLRPDEIAAALAGDTAHDTGHDTGHDTALGVIDDPDRQRRLALTWSPDDGNLLVAGSLGSGVTTTLHALAVRALHAGAHVYVIDARGEQQRCATGWDALAAHPACGAVVRLHERERLGRLLTMACAHGGTPAAQPWVVVVDGLDALRRAVDDPALVEHGDRLAELLAAGGRGVSVVAGVEQVAAVPASFLAGCASRWVLHLHDPHDAELLGVPAASVPTAIPGRLVVADIRATAQLALPATLRADIAGRATSARAVLALPPAVDAAALPPAMQRDGTAVLPLGLAYADGALVTVHRRAGDHLLVLGPPRSGRSSALGHLASSWREAHPDGWLGVVQPRRAGRPVDADLIAEGATVASAALTAAAELRPVLLVVDDAETTDDLDGALAAVARDGRATVFAAAGADALRQTYGHWTSILRRSRTGLVACGGGDLDGDLLGAVLPRRTPIAPRPGLMWLVEGGLEQLVQVALRRS